MIERLFNWLDKSTSSFLAIKEIKKELDANGFKELRQNEKWEITPGSKYYMTKNDTAVFAFISGKKIEGNGNFGFRIISAHSDSPCFKIKPNPEIYGDGGVISLNVEKYGGGINFTWFDRPLSMSGRVTVKGENPFQPKSLIFDLDKPFATIPNLAIHFNRSVNESFSTSVQNDMKPIVGYFTSEELREIKEKGGIIKMILADTLKVSQEDILDYELSLYPYEKAAFCGVNNEYFQSGRIDDLSMAFAGLEALISTEYGECNDTRILAIFDNEETGSGTKQGAASPTLRDLMERVVINLGGSREDFFRSIGNSFMISADDAHAWHPNYNSKYDPTNHPVIGGGPVIKINSKGKYMTDADGSAVFKRLCEEAGVKWQCFVNHSDSAGGSTLGNILTSNIDLRGVDVGNAIWAMHSARETAGVSDHIDMVKVFVRFWEC